MAKNTIHRHLFRPPGKKSASMEVLISRRCRCCGREFQEIIYDGIKMKVRKSDYWSVCSMCHDQIELMSHRGSKKSFLHEEKIEEGGASETKDLKCFFFPDFLD